MNQNLHIVALQWTYKTHKVGYWKYIKIFSYEFTSKTGTEEITFELFYYYD